MAFGGHADLDRSVLFQLSNHLGRFAWQTIRVDGIYPLDVCNYCISCVGVFCRPANDHAQRFGARGDGASGLVGDHMASEFRHFDFSLERLLNSDRVPVDESISARSNGGPSRGDLHARAIVRIDVGHVLAGLAFGVVPSSVRERKHGWAIDPRRNDPDPRQRHRVVAEPERELNRYGTGHVPFPGSLVGVSEPGWGAAKRTRRQVGVN